jgi:hypothetical protein
MCAPVTKISIKSFKKVGKMESLSHTLLNAAHSSRGLLESENLSLVRCCGLFSQKDQNQLSSFTNENDLTCRMSSRSSKGGSSTLLTVAKLAILLTTCAHCGCTRNQIQTMTSSKSGRLPTLVFPHPSINQISVTSQANLELETLLVNPSSGSKETWISLWQSLLVLGRRFREFVWLFLDSLPKKPVPLTLCSDGTTHGVVSPRPSFGPLLHFLRRSSEI